MSALLLPQPQNSFDVDPSIIGELADAVEGGLSIHLGHISTRAEGLVLSLASGLIDACSESMREPTRQIHVIHSVVQPGEAHLVPLWHTDEIGGEQRVVVANCLPVEFASGEVASESSFGVAFDARREADKGKKNFNTAVEESLRTGLLVMHKGHPFGATTFTKDHAHRSATNKSDEPVDRLYFKAVS